MKFHIYLLQKKAEPLYQQAMEEYQKRLGAYGTVSVHYMKNQRQAEQQKKQEGRHFLVVSGKKTYTSPGFAKELEQCAVKGVSVFNFYIGEFPKEGMEQFCVSSFSVNKSLTAVILMEQIYRSFRIMNHQPYHK